MGFLLSTAFDNAVVVALLAVVVLVVDRLARRPALAHRLWLLLLIKLLTPPMVSVGIALPELTRPARPISRPAPDRIEPMPGLPVLPAGMGMGPGAGPVADAVRVGGEPGPRSPGLAAGAATLARDAAAQVSLGWDRILAGLWLATSGLFLAWSLIGIVRVRVRLDAVPPAPAATQELAGRVAQELGLRRCPRVWLVPATIAPALWAVGRRPRLLVPAQLWDRLGDEQRVALLAHELAHWKRRDHWVRWLELAATAFYWWLPVLWWIRRSLHEAEEQCCDAWVVWALPGSERAYARTLLDTIDFLAEERPALPLASSGVGSVATMKLRLGRLMQGVAPPRLSRAGVLAVVGLAGVLYPLTLLHPPARGFGRGYQVVDLGRFYPGAINNAGQIVGSPMDPQLRRAHRWDRGHWTDLGGPVEAISFACDINDLGQATGWFCLPRAARSGDEPSAQLHHNLKSSHELGAGAIHQVFYDLNWNGGRPGPSYSYPHAFRTSPDRAFNPETDDLGTLGGLESYGMAINNLGQVAGESTRLRPGAPHVISAYPFRTAPNRPIDPETDDLHRSGGFTNWSEIDLNNLGEVAVQVVLQPRDGLTLDRPYRTPPGRAIDPEFDDLGDGPASGRPTELKVLGINDRGEVLGRLVIWEEGLPREHTFRTAPRRPIAWPADELCGLIRPQVINNQGHVLGTAAAAMRQSWDYQAIHDGSAVYLLRDLLPPGTGWRIAATADINDRDQIVGWGINPRGEARGILLEPSPDTGPLDWLLAGMILTGLGRAVGRIGTRS
jgi:beta-lactamase regulating signal transducer with metallopeptidase domain